MKQNTKKYKNSLLEVRSRGLNTLLNRQHSLEHLDLAATGVEFIDDSKATNVQSTAYSLTCMDAKVYWIVDSHELVQDYSMLNEYVQSKVQKILAIGDKSESIMSTFPTVDGQGYDTLEDAFADLTDLSSGSKVLFSPACPTDNRYENYSVRGDSFKQLAEQLF